jgi:hypothetical protein
METIDFIEYGVRVFAVLVPLAIAYEICKNNRKFFNRIFNNKNNGTAH